MEDGAGSARAIGIGGTISASLSLETVRLEAFKYNNDTLLFECSKSIDVELTVILKSQHRKKEHVSTRGGCHVSEDGADVVLDAVDLLLVPVHDLVSVEDHVASKQSWNTSSKPDTQETVEGLRGKFMV